MERMFKKFLSVAALLSVVAIQADSTATPGVVTEVIQRPVSFNAARRNAGEFGKVHKYDEESWYGNFSIAPGYERTFRGGKMASCLFGDLLTTNSNVNFGNSCNRDCDDSCGVLLVQGSNVVNRSANAVLADYFYLPADYNSTLSFKPQISNFFIDFNFYLGLDEWWKGGYVRLYAPFVHSRRTLHMRETVINAGSDETPGIFTSGVTPRASLLPNATAFLSGAAPETTQGVTFNGLCFSKINGGQECDNSCEGSRTRNGFGDIRAELGWNFWQNEDGHFGLNLQAAAPSGSRPKGEFLFDAVVGNGKHWELGGGATGHYTFWRGSDETRQFSINMDLSVLHLFGSRQQRIFDLAGKPLSRYALAAQYRPATDADTLFGAGEDDADPVKANFIFNNAYSPVANLTTQDVKVSVSAQVDFNAWFNFTAGGFSADLGYNLWYRGCEKFGCSNDKCPTQCCPVTFAENTWALKGTEYVFGYDTTTDPEVPAAVALSASSSSATIINGGQNTSPAPLNGSIDNPLLAFNGDIPLTNFAGNDDTGPFINTSIQPVFISPADLVAAVANATRSRQLSNKVWANFQYTWDREGWIPYLGAGASGEFGGRGCEDKCNNNTSSSNCNTSCDNCVNCTPSQWAVWVKTGFQF